MSLTFDYLYNRNLVNKLSNHGYVWEPTNFKDLKGGYRRGDKKYLLPGSSVNYPIFDMVSQRIYDKGEPLAGEAIMKVRPSRPIAPSQKGGSSKKKVSQYENLAYDIVDSLDNEEMSGGSINWGKVKRIATPILKKAISKGLDVGAPALGAAVAGLIAGPEAGPVGAMVGKLGREMIKESTGYGRNLKENKDVGIYRGGSSKSKPKPKAKPKPRAKPKPKNEVQSRRDKRNDKVREIMKERNVNLCTTSKIVKDENLY